MVSQRDTGYERKERDLYETPAWVTDVLCLIFPACGSGKMVDALRSGGHTVDVKEPGPKTVVNRREPSPRPKPRRAMFVPAFRVMGASNKPVSAL